MLEYKKITSITDCLKAKARTIQTVTIFAAEDDLPKNDKVYVYHIITATSFPW